ncbi:hypothetical protein ACUN9W_28080, partial [Escherichia coli]
MNKSGKYLVWTVLSVMGAFALGYIALNRGEQINAPWLANIKYLYYNPSVAKTRGDSTP